MRRLGAIVGVVRGWWGLDQSPQVRRLGGTPGGDSRGVRGAVAPLTVSFGKVYCVCSFPPLGGIEGGSHSGYTSYYCAD